MRPLNQPFTFLAAAALTAPLMTPAGAAPQVVVDAGLDQTVTYPNDVILHGAIDGGTPLEYWAADGNGVFEDKLAKYHSINGLSAVGPLQDGQGLSFPWPTDMVWINGVLYGHDNFRSQIYTLDHVSGIVTPIGSAHPQWDDIYSMAYDAVNDRLFAIDLQDKQLFRINYTTGDLTKVGNKTLFGNNFIRALAYDEVNDRLIAEDTGQEILIEIDPVTGLWSYLMDSYQDVRSRTEELQFFEGELYAARGLQNPPTPGDPPGGVSPIAGQLQHIDLVTGLFTNMGPVLDDVQAHSMVVQSVPETPSWSQTSGPGVATIQNPRDLNTTVSFDTPGVYVLTLSVTVAATSYMDDVCVTVTLDTTTYCTSKITSCGGVPAIGSSGQSSAAASSGFILEATGAKANKKGLVIYSDQGRRLPATPFGGGFLCIESPRRAPLVTSSGTPPLCDGVFSFDMNAFADGQIGGTPKAYLSVPGTTVNVQWWGRDTFAFGNYLSDAIEYVVGP